MREPKTPETGQHSERRIKTDAVTVIIMGCLAAAATLSLAVSKFLTLFVPGGVSWKVPVTPVPGSATGLTLYTQEGPLEPTHITGTIMDLQVVVTGVNSISLACLAIAIVAAAFTSLALIACIMRLAWNFLRGNFFTRQTSFTLRAFIWAALSGGIISFAAWKFGSNGVEAALESRLDDSAGLAWWSWYVLLLFGLVASGLIEIAFRRAERLQHDQEGLV